MSLNSVARCSFNNIYRIQQRFYQKAKAFPRICLVGAPGSGKGTVSKYLMEEFDLMSVSTGDILRDHINDETELGKKVKKIMSEGDLVPDDIMMELISEEVQKLEKGWILDGIPRTESQAEQVENMLDSLSLNLNAVYFIDVPDKEIVSRISGRLVHAPSGRTYHVEYNPPKDKGIDDVTGEPLSQREDDKPETVLARLEAFHSKTKPVLEFFKNKKILETIQAETSDEAFSLIKPKLQKVIKKE